MIIELRKKSQITLPKEIVKELKLQEGDKFDVLIENGGIKLEPIAIYSKEYMGELAMELKVIRQDQSLNCQSFENVDELLKSLNMDEYYGQK